MYKIALSMVVCFVGAVSALAQGDSAADPLVRLLETKGVLTATEARTIAENASPKEQRDRLAVLLRDKGVISSSEFETLQTTVTSAALKTITADYKVPESNKP